jgi:hypothetical protein
VYSTVRTPLLDPTGRYSSHCYRHCTNFFEACKANFVDLRIAKVQLLSIHLPRIRVNRGIMHRVAYRILVASLVVYLLLVVRLSLLERTGFIELGRGR